MDQARHPPLALSEAVSGLVFPLIVLLAGAIVSGLLVPRLVNAREERRRSLELKTIFVADISEAVMRFLIAIQFAELARRSGGTGAQLEEANESYKRWEIDAAIIGTKLNAYFPDSEIGLRWSQFARDLTDFYALLGVDDAQRASSMTQRLGEHYARPARDDPWGAIREGLVRAKDEMIESILAAPLRVERVRPGPRQRRTSHP